MSYDLRFSTPLTRLARGEDLFDTLFGAAAPTLSNGKAWAPTLDVTETAEGYEVAVEVAGIDPADVTVSFDKDTLLLEGEKKTRREHQEGDKLHVRERSYGKFRRSLRFPVPVDVDGVSADAEHGVLTVRVPKQAAAQPRQIAIEVKAKPVADGADAASA